MHQTPALDVPVRPLRPAVVALYGKARGISGVAACLITLAGVTPVARLTVARHGGGDRSVPLMPPEKITVRLDAALAEWAALSPLVAFPAVVPPTAPMAMPHAVGRRSKGVRHGAS